MNLDKILYNILNEIGIPAHLSGREYLECAIKQVYALGHVPTMMKLYARIAEDYGIKPIRAERNIRTAIEYAFSNGDTDVLYKYFGNTAKLDSGKTVNSAFICTLARYLQLFGDELEI